MYIKNILYNKCNFIEGFATLWKSILTMVSPMVGFDMTSPSISGHQRISLNDGNIFDSILMLQPKFPKDPGPPPAAAPAAMAAAATAAAAAGFAAKMADEEEPRAEMADDVTATASVAMMISRKKNKEKITIGKLRYSRGWVGYQNLSDCPQVTI